MKQVFILCLVALFYVVALPSASALTISPVRVEVSGDPGQTLRGELEIYNEQADAKRFFTSFENFEPSGDTGSPHFIGSETGLATWMSTEQSVAIESLGKKIIPYYINIPKDAEPGGYFAAIFLGEQDPSVLQAGEVSIGGKLGVLILLRVNGDIDEAAGVSGFGASKRVFSSVPVSFSYRFTNDGGDRVVPLGEIVIKNTFGSVSKTIPANTLEGNVLPSSGRTFTSVWEGGGQAPQGYFGHVLYQLRNMHIGMYKADMRVVYGQTNQAAYGSFTFFIFPWQLLSLVCVALIVLLVLLKQYNRWIIARSRA